MGKYRRHRYIKKVKQYSKKANAQRLAPGSASRCRIKSRQIKLQGFSSAAFGDI
jgi:hypothetical protein